MKKLFRKPLALVIALAIVLTSLSIAVSADDTEIVTKKLTTNVVLSLADKDGNYTITADAARNVSAKKGDKVKADIYLTTDYCAASTEVMVAYSKDILTFDDSKKPSKSATDTDIDLKVETTYHGSYTGATYHDDATGKDVKILDTDKYSFLRVSMPVGIAQTFNNYKLCSLYFTVNSSGFNAADTGVVKIPEFSQQCIAHENFNTTAPMVTDPDSCDKGLLGTEVPSDAIVTPSQMYYNYVDWDDETEYYFDLELITSYDKLAFSGDVKLDCAGGTIEGMTPDKDTTDKYTIKDFNGDYFDSSKILANPKKQDGSEFRGWTLSTDTSDPKVVYKTEELPDTIKHANGNDTVTLTAVYKGVGSIKIDAKGGTIAGMTPDASTTDKYTITGPEGDPIDTSKIPADPDKGDGSKFLGWTYGSVTTPVKTAALPDTIKFATSGVVTLTAVYQEVGSIKIDADGGTIAGMTPDASTTDKYTITGLDGESIDKTQILADPVKSGADFIGWTYGAVTTPVLTKDLPDTIKYGLNENVVTLKANYRELGKITVSAGDGKLKFGSKTTELTSIDFIGYTDEAFTLDSKVKYDGIEYKLSEITAIPNDNSKEFSKWVIPTNQKYSASIPAPEVTPEYVGAQTSFKIEIYEQGLDGTYPATAAKTATITADSESKPYRAGMKITLTAEQAATLASYTPGDNFKAIGNASITPATETELVATAASNVFKVEVPRKTVSKVIWKTDDGSTVEKPLQTPVKAGSTFTEAAPKTEATEDFDYDFGTLPTTFVPDSGKDTMTINGTKIYKDASFTITVLEQKPDLSGYEEKATKTIENNSEGKHYKAGDTVELTVSQAAALVNNYVPGSDFKAIADATINKPSIDLTYVGPNGFTITVYRKIVSKVEWKIGDEKVGEKTLSPNVGSGTDFAESAPTSTYYNYNFGDLPRKYVPDANSTTMTITGSKTGKDVTVNYTATVKDSDDKDVTITFAPTEAQVTKYGVIGAIAKTASAPAGYNIKGYTYKNASGVDTSLNNSATLPPITAEYYTIANNEGALSITLTPVIEKKTDITVTVKFKDADGATSTVKTISGLTYNESFEMPAMTTYEKDGYSYAWDQTLTTVPAVDTTITYVETAKKVDVKFAGKSAGQVDFNKAIPDANIPDVPTAQGKTPNAWALEIDGVKYTYDFTKTIEQNIKALSKAYSSTITFVPVYSSTDHFYIVTGYNNGFIWEEKTEFAKTWVQDEAATPYTVPTIPAMEGYVVNGWKLDKDGANLGATNTNIETDRNYYATYDIKQFDVIFLNEDGTNYADRAYDARGVKFGEQFPAAPAVQPADKSEKEVFDQWVDQNGNPYGAFSTMPDIGDTGAQLIYKPTYKTIEVPYTWMSTDNFGKEYQFAVTTNNANTPVVYPESEPTRFGMKFVGWADENGQAPGELAGSEEKTYYAQFEVDKTFVAVVVGGAVVSGTVIATAAAANAALITGAAIGTAVIGGVVIAKHTYTVTYMVDGEVYKTYKILEGTKVFTPKDPVKDGSVFKGWDNVPEKMPAKDITINAVWGAADEDIIPNTGSSSASIAAFAAISGAAAAAYVISRRKKEI